MVGFNIWGVGAELGVVWAARVCWGRIGAGSVLTTGGGGGGRGSSSFMTLTGTAFPPPLPVLPFPLELFPPETEVGAGLCGPFLLFGVDFLTGKMREMAARFVAESSAGGCCEAVWLLER